MQFEFATSNRIIFGEGVANQLGVLATQFGHRVLVVTGKRSDRHPEPLDALEGAGVTTRLFAAPTEPDIHQIQRGVELAHDFGAEAIVAIGGGSVIDSGKAIAAIAANPGSLQTYLEVVGDGQPLQADPLPFIAVPTTAGTGAEVTKNAVLLVPEAQVKVSLRDQRMIPDIALVDPALTLSLPPAVTATTGLDALTQVIEPFVSVYANPITDALCREGIRRAGQALRSAYEQPENREARKDMMLVSLLGGLALANAKLGAVHGFAGALGGRTQAPHGAICGSLLPHVLAKNIDILQRDQHPMLTRYREVARLLTRKERATLDDLLAWIWQTVATFHIPTLAALGLAADDIEAIARQSAKSSSMRGNSVALTHTQLVEILEAAY